MKSLIMIIKTFRRKLINKRILYYDANRYAEQYANSNLSYANGNKAARDIMVYCHVVEKGLSHKKLKPLFGHERVIQILDSLEQYINVGGSDRFIISMALSTLTHYNNINRKLGVDEDKLIQIPQDISYLKLDIGAHELSEELFFGKKFDFSSFSASRHSLRPYDFISDPIDDMDIIDSIKVAQTAPSACNRQSTRIKIVKNKELMGKIFCAQGGSNGFGENAGSLLVITADLSLYEPAERRLPLLDAGLFIMNLVYSLHNNKIGTCILNASFTLDRELKMQELVPIPQNEMYCAILALSKIPPFETVMVAESCKRDVKDIVTYL